METHPHSSFLSQFLRRNLMISNMMDAIESIDVESMNIDLNILYECISYNILKFEFMA